jgi:hypothetical protein
MTRILSPTYICWYASLLPYCTLVRPTTSLLESWTLYSGSGQLRTALTPGSDPGQLHELRAFTC